jgi:hypothetical protein
MTGIDVKQLEATAYRESFSDGLVDVFVGLGLLWIGASWILLPSLVPLSVVVPPLLAVALFPVRQRVLEPRVGYVRWTAPRRHWERRQLVGLFAAGATAFGLVAFLGSYAIANGVTLPEAHTFAAAIPAVLVAIPALAVAVATGLVRVWVYLLILVIAAGVTVAYALDPGWPLAVTGLGVLLGGVWLLTRFLRSNPRQASDV